MDEPAAFNRGKFKEMVLYFALRSAELKDEDFGIVKLNKLLYRADFEAYRTLGHAITGEAYERQEFGPVARDLPIVLDELGANGRLRWGDIPVGPHTLFSEDELGVMERVLQESDWSHEQSAGWTLATVDGNVIEYRTAFVPSDPLPPGFLKHASEYVRAQGWIKAS